MLVGSAPLQYKPTNVLQLDRQFVNYNFRYFGSFGPYANGKDQSIGRDPPDNCEVDMLVLLSRNAETYPSESDLHAIKDVVAKILGNYSTLTTNSPFSWDSQVLDAAQDHADQLIDGGPHAGVGTMFSLGALYRQRYGQLLDNMEDESRIIYSSDDDSIKNSATEFGRGMFASTESNNFRIFNVLSESSAGANSFEPTCHTAQLTLGVQFSVFDELDEAAQRLQTALPQSAELNATDVYYLMRLAALETLVQGYSPWITMFTPDEWTAFQYYDNANHFYMQGPGLNTSAAVGSVFANSSLNLLADIVPEGSNSSSSNLVLCFAPEATILQFIGAIHLMCPVANLPTDNIAHHTTYQMSEIIPMGGHIAIERLSCAGYNGTDADTHSKFVRFVLNEAVVPLDDCQSGPGFSCPISEYKSKLDKILPVYKYACNVPSDDPSDFTLFWDH